MLHAVSLPDRPRTDQDDVVHGATMCFHSVGAKAERAAHLMAMSVLPLPERVSTARLEARALIRELLPLADMPEYQSCLRVLHEVRRELGVQSRQPDLVALRRNLALYLDGAPESD